MQFSAAANSTTRESYQNPARITLSQTWPRWCAKSPNTKRRVGAHTNSSLLFSKSLFTVDSSSDYYEDDDTDDQEAQVGGYVSEPTVGTTRTQPTGKGYSLSDNELEGEESETEYRTNWYVKVNLSEKWKILSLGIFQINGPQRRTTHDITFKFVTVKRLFRKDVSFMFSNSSAH